MREGLFCSKAAQEQLLLHTMCGQARQLAS